MSPFCRAAGRTGPGPPRPGTRVTRLRAAGRRGADGPAAGPRPDAVARITGLPEEGIWEAARLIGEAG
ncbi:hypothetical protein, partial [Streptomyces minutiscleroticus]|uniref:hypothetical protein n=1 Tax=Streptomyces minutiscleroticus TaxID=68238 RepID=UPI0033218CD9